MSSDVCLLCGERFEYVDAAQCFTAWEPVTEMWMLICDGCADAVAEEEAVAMV